MGLIREPKNVDFTVESKPWTEVELRDFRKLMTELKAKNAARKLSRKVGKGSEATARKKESDCVTQPPLCLVFYKIKNVECYPES